MRVLVIGAGRMGRIRAEDLAADPHVDEVLIANRSRDRAAALATDVGGRVVPWQEATEADAGVDADAVVVTVGTDAHHSLLEALLPRGLPVLCEKPIALTLADTQAAIALAAKHRTPFQIGFQRRFDPQIRTLHDDIAAGRLGTLYSLTMTAHDRTPAERAFIAGSGGIYRDMHVHDFDLIRWLTGSEVAHVFASGSVREWQQYSEFDDADVTAIHAVTESGVQVVITGTRHDALGHDVRLEAFGSADSVSAGLNIRTPLRSIEGDLPLNTDPYTGFVDRFREAFRAETAAFAAFAAGEIDNPCPPDSALESLRIAVACERSITEQRPVRPADVTA